MISYEDLCQALDHFNARRRNAAEMAELAGDAAETGAVADDAAAAAMAMPDPVAVEYAPDDAASAHYVDAEELDAEELDANALVDDAQGDSGALSGEETQIASSPPEMADEPVYEVSDGELAPPELDGDDDDDDDGFGGHGNEDPTRVG